MRTTRAFIAHAKSDPDDYLAKLHREITAALVVAAAGRAKVIVTLGRDDYAANAAQAGGWDGWARHVALGIHYLTREPHYSVIIVPSERVGQATRTIVEMALPTKPVLRWDGHTFIKVTRVWKIAERDFKTGWQVG